MHIFFAYLFLLISSNLIAQSPLQILKQAQLQLDKEKFKKALKILAPLKIQKDFENSQHMQHAFKIKVIAYTEIGNKALARENMRKLYFINPDFVFNQFATRKKIINLARQVKNSIDAKNRGFAATKKNIQNQIKPDINRPNLETKIIQKEIFIKSPPAKITAFMPFGINFFVLDYPITGSIYLSLQSISLATNILSYWWKSSYLTKNSAIKNQNSPWENKFHKAQTLQFVSLGALALSFSISVVHALISHKNIAN